jgi:YbgC/YbaW family acyl-CoA thioester hydrolase
MFIHRVRINFFDCDPAGILFYGNIYRLCHSAYEEVISSFSLGEDYWNNDNYVVPISVSEAKYLKPIKYDETIIIELSVSILKRGSFELQYKCKNINGDICAEVRTVHIFVDKKEWRKKELSKEIREGLQKHIIIF